MQEAIHELKLSVSTGSKITFTLTKGHLTKISRLYYGARCILAHGKSDKTLGKEGVLYELNEQLDDIDQNREIIMEFKRFFTEVTTKSKSASFDYSQIETMRHFYRVAGIGLYNAVTQLIKDKFKRDLWTKHSPAPSYSGDTQDGSTIDDDGMDTESVHREDTHSLVTR